MPCDRAVSAPPLLSLSATTTGGMCSGPGARGCGAFYSTAPGTTLMSPTVPGFAAWLRLSSTFKGPSGGLDYRAALTPPLRAIYLENMQQPLLPPSGVDQLPVQSELP